MDALTEGGGNPARGSDEMEKANSDEEDGNGNLRQRNPVVPDESAASLRDRVEADRRRELGQEEDPLLGVETEESESVPAGDPSARAVSSDVDWDIIDDIDTPNNSMFRSRRSSKQG